MNDPDPPVDFTRSLPPQPAELASAMRDALHAAGGGAAAELIRAASPGGSQADRDVAAAWLAGRFGCALDPDRVLLTNGTQTSFLLVARHLVEAGRAVLVEGLTWTVLGAVAAQARVRLVPVELDEQGLRPDALAEACRRERPALIYCNPTHHNPTTATMSTPRRLEIAAVARDHDVAIFEDDVVGALHTDGPPPLAAIAPDVTWYSMGLTKCLAQGLRIGYLVGPDAARVASLRSPVDRLSHWVTHPVAAYIVRHWITTGLVPVITSAIRDESAARQRLARELLGAFTMRTHADSLHLWLGAPAGLSSLEYREAAASVGVLVRPAEMFSINARSCPDYVRLSLGAPATRADVRIGLQRLKAITHEGER